MDIRTRLFLYDSTQEANNYCGSDLSIFVLQGDSYKEDISDELDTCDLTLVGYPFRDEFTPETKFILQKYKVEKIEIDGETNIEETLIATYHITVDQDTVEQPILSNENYYNHHITFYEPSVVAQKRLVNNIAITYKLKDVNLETIPSFDINTESGTSNQASIYTPPQTFGNYSTGFLGYYTNSVWGKYFVLDGDIQMLKREETESGSTKLYQNVENYDIDGTFYAKFKIPKLKIYFGVQNTTGFSYIGDASLSYTIQEFNLNDYYNPTNTWIGDIISNSNLSNGNVSTYPLRMNEATAPAEYNEDEWLIEKMTYVGGAYSRHTVSVYTRKYTETTATAPTYLTEEIQIKSDKRYIITINLKEFDDYINKEYIGGILSPSYLISTKDIPVRFSSYLFGTFDYSPTLNFTQFTQSQAGFNSSFQTYSTDSVKILLQSSNPYNALALLQKAIINSHFIEKEQDVFIGDINNMSTPFYVDEDFVDELYRTQIIENFYSQKNLWEILVEVGKYIHSVPRLEFGTDDKFKITFDRLGETDQQTDECYKASIMNFRGVADYISACSSYITNMVQLNGYVEEWVAPKTNNEQALVYNDTCTINVSKPIIELIDIEIKCVSGTYVFADVGDIANMTQYIYEKNVYKLLSVAFTDLPNKGVALYYQLGQSSILGCDYKNPTANSGDSQNDYAIKKIIYCAFLGGYPDDFTTTTDWSNIKVNDFIFHIKYRTKDSVRQNQTRPDLRKYLLNSKHDRVPQHNQFNNQTDILVDSVKFGNNVYGKLIRTGNKNYKITEWIDDLKKLKHKGQLYRIENDLYYVSKVKHTYYNSYILSEVEYSKDYNQLSQVIGIPSEPRFYEVSEQSLIQSEVVISDYLIISDDQTKINSSNTFLQSINHIASLIFSEENSDFAKYAITTFKGDKNISPTDIVQGSNEFYKDVITPINAYSSENTLTYEWDMVDNFSAGNKVDLSGNTDGVETADNAYKSLKAVQYNDIFGKAPLMDFYLLKDLPTLTAEQIQNMPESPFRTRLVGRDDEENAKSFIGSETIKPLVISTNVTDMEDTDYNGRGIGLLKDCREVISINYNEELLTNSDTYIISPYVFTPNKTNIRMVLLNKEVNKLSSGFINKSDIITPFNTSGSQMSSQYFTLISNEIGSGKIFRLQTSTIFADVNTNHFGDGNGEDVIGYERVKSIAILFEVVEGSTESNVSKSYSYQTKFVIAKNIPDLEPYWGKTNATKNWFMGGVSKSGLFTNKQ